MELKEGGKYNVNINSVNYNIKVISIDDGIVYFDADKIEDSTTIPMDVGMHENIKNIEVIQEGYKLDGGNARRRVKYSKKRSKRRSTKRRSTKRRSTKRRSTKRKSKQRKYKKTRRRRH